MNLVKVTALDLCDPCNAHEHCREGDLRLAILPYICAAYSSFLVMPNTQKPLMLGIEALRHAEDIYRDIKLLGMNPANYRLISAIYIGQESTPEIIYTARSAGVPAGKGYPWNGTHNSAYGIRDYHAKLDCWRAMEACGMKALLHCEVPDPGIPPEDREWCFIPILEMIRDECPDLEIVVEHISDARMLDFVLRTPKMYATVGPQHLVLTREDADSSVHNLCMPIAKTKEDNQRLLWEITHGDSEGKLMNGTDSAAHTIENKIKNKAPGVYSDPVALQILAELFERESALDRLQAFVSRGNKFYGVPPLGKTVRLIKQSWRVPYKYNGIVPLWAGRKISWRIATSDPII